MVNEFVGLIIGVFVLILGIPIGNLIALWTKDELDSGQKYFRILVLIGLIGGLVGLILGNDVFLFTMFFIAIVTSRSVRRLRKKEKKKNVKN
jgi:NADH:ubiquinone oxidoreductase subunit 4 (subunit M)